MKKLLLSAAAIGSLSFGAAAQNRTTTIPANAQPEQTTQPAKTSQEAQPASTTEQNKQMSNTENAAPANAQPDPIQAAPVAAPADSQEKKS
jgi:hypothetical protein